MKEIKQVTEYSHPEVEIKRNNHFTTLTFKPNDNAYAYAVYRVEGEAPFNPGTAKMFDIVYNRDKTIDMAYPAEREKSYRYYIRTLSVSYTHLNPARHEVRQHIYNTISEVVHKYDVDAIHFDDYFYNGVDHSEDAADYDAYRQGGGTLSKDDWRREQVNILIKGIHDLLENLNHKLGRNVEFGISPAGVWAASNTECSPPYGQPGGMTGILCYSYSSDVYKRQILYIANPLTVSNE